MTTQEVVDELFSYHHTHNVRAPWYWHMLSMGRDQVAVIVRGCTTFEQGWRTVRSYFRYEKTADPASCPCHEPAVFGHQWGCPTGEGAFSQDSFGY